MAKKRIIQTIYDVLEDPLGLDTKKIGTAEYLAELYVDTDDWSFLFISEIEKRLGISVPVNEWNTVDFTIEGVAEMLVKHFKKRTNDLASPCT